MLWCASHFVTQPQAAAAPQGVRVHACNDKGKRPAKAQKMLQPGSSCCRSQPVTPQGQHSWAATAQLQASAQQSWVKARVLLGSADNNVKARSPPVPSKGTTSSATHKSMPRVGGIALNPAKAPAQGWDCQTLLVRSRVQHSTLQHNNPAQQGPTQCCQPACRHLPSANPQTF
jgi:hypothetical protein